MVLTLEKEFAARSKVKYALAVNSGTSALETALAALEVGPGDEVIVPAWTWHSCFHAVVRLGALPVCSEIDGSFNLDPDRVEAQFTPRTKVLMTVHLQGNPADMDRLVPIARRHGVKVLEDVSQAVGASYKGRPLGSIGDIAACSLQVNKTISAGEGGIVYTSDPLLFERAVRFHDVGTMRAPHQDWLGQSKLEAMPGSNFRMNEFTASVLVAQVRKLDRIVGDIRAVSRRVYDGIADLPGLKLRLRPDPAGELGVGVYIEFPSKDERDRFLAAMRAENVPASGPSGSAILPIQGYAERKLTVHPEWPTFQSPRGKQIQYGRASCPRTIDVLDRFGGVLFDPGYSESDTRDVVAAIRKVWPSVRA
jgi:8-amino-3,8-dideoxy-alpha-D-manno-octulosonate transaminase